MGRFRSQPLLEDNIWSARYNISKRYQGSFSSVDWNLVSANVTIEIYGINLIFDQTDTPHADMRLSDITITWILKGQYKIFQVFVWIDSRSQKICF